MNSELEFWERYGKALGRALNFIPAIAGDQILREVEATRGTQVAARRELLKAFREITRQCLQALHGQDSFEVQTLRAEFESMSEVLSLEYTECLSPQPPLVEVRPRDSEDGSGGRN